MSCIPTRSGKADEPRLAMAFHLMVDAPPRPELLASVILPAKNEAESLARCLTALAAQTGMAAEQYEVILLINNSEDASAAIASQFQQDHPSFRLHVLNRHFAEPDAHIGHVRRLLMNEAHQRLERAAPGQGVMLSTDADSEVAPDWIAQNLLEIRRGAEAVGGAIVLMPDERNALDPKTKETQQLDERYRTLSCWLEDHCDPQPYDPWPRHHHHFGGSLAVTTRAYELVGGLPAERQLEDVAFYERLVRHDVQFRHSPAVQIWTSARLTGRTAVGLAEQLNQWHKPEHSGKAGLVGSVDQLSRLFRSRRLLRRVWHSLQQGGEPDEQKLERFCRETGFERSQVMEALSQPYFGAAWHKLDAEAHLTRQPKDACDGQPLAEAVADLEALFARFRESGQELPLREGQSDTVPV